jgi:hypothetical protein
LAFPHIAPRGRPNGQSFSHLGNMARAVTLIPRAHHFKFSAESKLNA